MIKRLIKQMFCALGYSVHRAAPNENPADPFVEMQRLCGASRPLTIFDVGAHHGSISRQFRHLFPVATVYAFEPFPSSFAILQSNTKDDPAIKSFPFGLADADGQRQFSSNRSSATNSLLETAPDGALTWGDGLLDTLQRDTAHFVTLDSICTRFKIGQIDILKMDVQGAEPLVLAGARKSLEAGRIQFVYAEILTLPTYHGQKSFSETLQNYHDYGFELHGLYHLSQTADGRLRQVDAIFSHRAFRPPIVASPTTAR